MVLLALVHQVAPVVPLTLEHQVVLLALEGPVAPEDPVVPLARENIRWPN